MAKQNGCYCLGCLCKVSRQISSSYDTLGADRINFRDLGKDLRFESRWTICSSKSWLTLVNFHGIVAQKGRPLWFKCSKTNGTSHIPNFWTEAILCSTIANCIKARISFNQLTYWNAVGSPLRLNHTRLPVQYLINFHGIRAQMDMLPKVESNETNSSFATPMCSFLFTTNLQHSVRLQNWTLRRWTTCDAVLTEPPNKPFQQFERLGNVSSLAQIWKLPALGNNTETGGYQTMQYANKGYQFHLLLPQMLRFPLFP